MSEGIMHQNTDFFFNTNNLHHFLAIDAIEKPYYRKVSNNTIGSDSHSEKIIRKLREDLELIEHVGKDGLKKYIGYTDEGEKYLAKLKDYGFDPEDALYE